MGVCVEVATIVSKIYGEAAAVVAVVASWRAGIKVQ